MLLLFKYFNGPVSTEGVMHVSKFSTVWVDSVFRIFTPPKIDKYTWIPVWNESDKVQLNRSTVIIIWTTCFNSKKTLPFACQCLSVPYDFRNKQRLFH
jgi:hypothetical protein